MKRRKRVNGCGCGCFTIAIVLIVLATLSGQVTWRKGLTDDTPPDSNNAVSKLFAGKNVNVLLMGIDQQAEGESTRADSMIVLTVDFKNGVVNLTSLMRDIYVDIPGKQKHKLNSAYSWGGPELTVKTINQNFETNLDYYAVIDFEALTALVDLVGGVDIEIKDYEVDELNKYIGDMDRILGGNSSTKLLDAGVQTLDGRQATAYCRIRYVGNADYERTERQRTVLSAIFDKLGNLNILKLPQTISKVLPLVDTNMSARTITKIGAQFLINKPTELETYRIPAPDSFTNATVDGMAVLDINWEENRMILQDIMYTVVD